MKSLTKLAVWSFLLVGATAFNFNALNTRDQTCSGKRSSTTRIQQNAKSLCLPTDGGVCLDIDGNVCCEGGPIGGCMFASGVCCQNGYFCYEGQFCSTTDKNADDTSGLDTNCCQDEACSTVIGLAPYIIAYSEQPFYSGAAGTGAMTSGASTPTATGSVAGTTSGGSKSTSSTASAKASPTTTPATQSTSSTASAASPTTSKSAGVRAPVQANTWGGIYAMLAVLGLGSLMVLL
jgi:hypothetical protein